MNKGRMSWWDKPPSYTVDESFRLSTKEQSSLGAAVDRVEAGYSPFDTHVHVPRRARRAVHDATTSKIFGHPIWAKKIDHSPG